MRLMKSDEYPAYAEAIREAYGVRAVPARPGRPGPPRKAYTGPDPRLVSATVHKERENNRVVRVSTREVFGTAGAVAASSVSRSVNTCFVGRHNGTDRNRCSRKVRESYGFSKDWDVHRAASMFGYLQLQFLLGGPHARVKADGRWRQRTPAMATGLTDHVWSLHEWRTYPRRTTQIGHHLRFR